jgi:prepilin-type N-terminal cleavage/methylation domain-containing protein
MGRSGFTLVELLVVIASITLLAAMLVTALAEARPYASTYPSTQPYSIVARHAGRINLLFLAGQVQSFVGLYIGCGKGDPGLADVRWLTGTASDAGAHNY